jgi:hypothetical protein
VAHPVARAILYVRDIPTVAAFYERFFNTKPVPGATDDWPILVLLVSSGLHGSNPEDQKQTAPRQFFLP